MVHAVINLMKEEIKSHTVKFMHKTFLSWKTYLDETELTLQNNHNSKLDTKLVTSIQKHINSQEVESKIIQMCFFLKQILRIYYRRIIWILIDGRVVKWRVIRYLKMYWRSIQTWRRRRRSRWCHPIFLYHLLSMSRTPVRYSDYSSKERRDAAGPRICMSCFSPPLNSLVVPKVSWGIKVCTIWALPSRLFFSAAF